VFCLVGSGIFFPPPVAFPQCPPFAFFRGFGSYNISDAANSIPGPRLKHLLSSSRSKELSGKSSSPTSDSDIDPLENLLHFRTPTLPHLIALLSHPVASFPPLETSLIVIDSFSSLVASNYPRHIDLAAIKRKPGASRSSLF